MGTTKAPADPRRGPGRVPDPMNKQRLGYQRLAETLVERGLVEAQAVQDALAIGDHGGAAFPEAVVSAGLVADWELSQLVCQLYGLPFLPVDIAEPDPEASRGLDTEFLLENGLVPLSRHGRVLTLCMPAIVPAETLGCISAINDLEVLPVVGTVNSNRRWLEANLAPEAPLPDMSGGTEVGTDWGSLFDDADADIQSELDILELPSEEPLVLEEGERPLISEDSDGPSGPVDLPPPPSRGDEDEEAA